MSASEIANALGGHKAGAGWMARCPAHDDRTPSLSICDAEDNKVLVRCHAGCEQERVITELRTRGLWTNNSPRSHPTQRSNVLHKPDKDDAKRTEVAFSIWKDTKSAGNTVVESYLASRGLHLLPPPTLRFHVGLKHPSGGMWPAIVALVTRALDDEPVAIHRTFLAQDGMSKAPVEPAKMTLGPCSGAVVRLGGQGQTLLIGEGIETSLSAMQATGHRTWAALSTSGLRGTALPNDERDLIILADADKAGEAAANDTARRWVREGRRVRIARPPQGMDFNDLLMAFHAEALAKVTASAADRSGHGGDLPWR